MARSKATKRQVFTKTTKETVTSKDAKGYYDMPVSFSFRMYDANVAWAATNTGRPTTDSVFNMLRGQEGQTWREVEHTYGGRSRGTNSHRIEIAQLSKEVQKRADEIHLYENELFSLRLQGSVRLWGVIEPLDGCFFVIWYDPEHQVYPVEKR